jgi:hypothetical protein
MDDLAWPVPQATCALIAQCHLNCCAQNDPPEQVHLSLAGTDHSIMGVSWTSLDQKASVVQYGLGPHLLTESQTGSLVAFTQDSKYTYWNCEYYFLCDAVNLDYAYHYYYCCWRFSISIHIQIRPVGSALCTLRR